MHVSNANTYQPSYTTLNLILSVIYYSELYIPISFAINVKFDQVEALILYNVQATNPTFVGNE